MASSLRDQLQAALGTAYRLDRELTGGGMSRVFVATEVALGRPVVVKVLHPELAADVTAERFSREIQLAARLQQANIVPLLTAGHTGNLPFYTMPFVEGLSLRQRLAESGRLGINETIGILRDVARALAYAHDAGVAHRDIKPENVLISGGAAVVTDFGIAKAISVARTQSTTPTITQAGTGIGTPAYMAPEQAAGDPNVDHRADIYAFGCMAYELLTGRPPFTSSAPHELFAAHLTLQPAPIASLRAEAPPRLATLIEHCLAKQPGERPQSARELLDALDAVGTPPSATATAASTGRRRGMMIAVAVILMIAIVGYVIGKGGATPPVAEANPSLAIIPFINVGGDSAQDYLADGLSDELATAIGRIPNVHLAARSGTYRYRGRRDVDVRDVGQTLGVAYVIQGTVRRADDRLRISAQLTDAKSGVELWAQSFDRVTKDVFRTQDDIASAIRNALAARTGRTAAAPIPAGNSAAIPQGTKDVDAYDLYLRGEFLLRRRQVLPAAEQFKKAIARDKDFARAYAGLSQTLALTPYYTSTSSDSVSAGIMQAATEALRRDSTLSEAHMSMALAHLYAWRWDESSAAFKRALDADPSDVQAHFQYGRFLFYRGDDQGALAEWNRAKAIDPFSSLAAAWTAQLLMFQGKNPEALAEIRRAIDYDSTAGVIKQMGSRVYAAIGDPKTARDIADRMPFIPPWSGMTTYIHAVTGDRAGAESRLKWLEASDPTIWFRYTGLAYAYLGLRDTTRALDALERAAKANEPWAAFNRAADPMFDPVRKTARWAAMLKRIGLDQTPGAIK